MMWHAYQNITVKLLVRPSLFQGHTKKRLIIKQAPRTAVPVSKRKGRSLLSYIAAALGAPNIFSFSFIYRGLSDAKRDKITDLNSCNQLFETEFG